jgi:hypothetical protein
VRIKASASRATLALGRPLLTRLFAVCSVVLCSSLLVGTLFAGLCCFVSEPAIAASGCPNAALRTGPSAVLPDCRVYEQVSSVEKNGYDTLVDHPQGLGGVPPFIEASPDGGSIDYFGYGATAGSLSHLLESMYLGHREPGGWSSVPLDFPEASVTANGGGTQNRELDVTPAHLDQPVARSLEPLAPGAPEAPEKELANLFLRQPGGSYALLTPYAPPAEQLGYATLEPVAVSSDASQVLFYATASLTPDMPPEASSGYDPLLYDWTAGATTFIGRLEDGAPAYASRALPFGNPISPDGSRVFWEGQATETSSQQVYMRAGASTTWVSKSQRSVPDPSGPQPAAFESASTDGSRVFLLSAEELTDGAHTGSADSSSDLYEYSVGSGRLADLSEDTNPLDSGSGAGVQGVAGTSSNGTGVYFVAAGQLVPGEGADGGPNLYLSRNGGPPTFIATLGSEDASDWGEPSFGIGAEGNPPRSAYVTPDGRYLAFSSTTPLTGYDNRDASSGLSDTEIFLYDSQTATLTCASCDPSSARPIGNAVLGNPYPDGYTPRDISDTSPAGVRLFFDSPDPLIPGSANGHYKVFEYEGGQILPISSGNGSTDDFFADASETGNDVFFTTRSQLVKEDQDQLVDMYDARAGGGFPPAPSSPSPCSGDDCQGPPSNAAVFEAGASALYGAGAPQPVQTGAAPPRPKTLSRSQRLALALRACRRATHNRHRRVHCETVARRRFGHPAARHRTARRVK